MKKRDFDIANYDVKSKIRELVSKKVTEVVFGEVTFKVKIRPYDVQCDDTSYEALSKEAKQEVIQSFKQDFDKKVKETIENFNTLKKKSDFIFCDDKEYKELVEVLEDNYYCQALTTLKDFCEVKLKGKTAKCLKYNARLQQFNNLSCD